MGRTVVVVLPRFLYSYKLKIDSLEWELFLHYLLFDLRTPIRVVTRYYIVYYFLMESPVLLFITNYTIVVDFVLDTMLLKLFIFVLIYRCTFSNTILQVPNLLHYYCYISYISTFVFGQYVFTFVNNNNCN